MPVITAPSIIGSFNEKTLLFWCGSSVGEGEMVGEAVGDGDGVGS